MCVLLGLGDAELLLAVLGNPLAEGVDEILGRIRAGGLDVCGILGQHDEISEGGNLLPCEAAEVRVDEGAGDLACAVCAEVHENHCIAVIYGGRGIADD